MEKRLTIILLSIVLAVVLGPVTPLYAYTSIEQKAVMAGSQLGGDSLEVSKVAAPGLNFDVTVESVLAPGVLGLPGEPVEWVVRVENTGSAVGYNVIVTTMLHEGLRVDAVDAVHGDVTIDNTEVSVAVSELAAGEVLAFSINTMVLRSPANGKLFNQTILSATGPAGAMTHSVSTEMYVPTGLPATGYAADEDLPGDGEPSVAAVGLMAFSTVMAAAVFVWYRGRKVWF